MRIFGSTIAQSTPHLYISGLPFTPLHSIIRSNYIRHYPRTLSIDLGHDMSWSATQLIITGHTGIVSCVVFSPDGKWIASCSWDRTIRVWDAETGVPTLQPLEEHSDWVTSVAFSPDGKQIVSGSEDRTIRLWSAETGELILQPLEGHNSTVTSVAFSHDGKQIVSGSEDNTLRVWRIHGELTREKLQCHNAGRYYINSLIYCFVYTDDPNFARLY